MRSSSCAPRRCTGACAARDRDGAAGRPRPRQGAARARGTCIRKGDAVARARCSIPAPGNGDDAGLAWADGSLWVGQYRARTIYQIDPDTGAIRRTIESNRFVTGVTWVDGELWHGTWEGGESDVRRVDPESGQVLQRLELNGGAYVTGLESDGRDLLYCGGGESGKVRAVRRPRKQR